MKTTIAALLLIAAVPAQAADADDRKAILGVLNQLFTAMTAKDAATINAITVPGAVMIDVKRQATDGKMAVAARPMAAFATMIGESKGRVVETIFDPEVRVRGPVASAIAGYTLDIDGVRSHCGTDIVDFVKADDGWKIAAITYSAMKDNCPK